MRTVLRLLDKHIDYPPYRFRSLGAEEEDDDGRVVYVESTDFPIGTEYVLTGGKFPFFIGGESGLFKDTGLYHTLNGNIKVKLIDHINCDENESTWRETNCEITVEKPTESELAALASREDKLRLTSAFLVADAKRLAPRGAPPPAPVPAPGGGKGRRRRKTNKRKHPKTKTAKRRGRR